MRRLRDPDAFHTTLTGDADDTDGINDANRSGNNEVVLHPLSRALSFDFFQPMAPFLPVLAVITHLLRDGGALLTVLFFALMLALPPEAVAQAYQPDPAWGRSLGGGAQANDIAPERPTPPARERRLRRASA
jgi:hypothetical protein